MARKIEYGLNSARNFRLIGFATGAYMQKCSNCGAGFTGDKLSFQCLECAIKLVELRLDELTKIQNSPRVWVDPEAGDREAPNGPYIRWSDIEPQLNPESNE